METPIQSLMAAASGGGSSPSSLPPPIKCSETKDALQPPSYADMMAGVHEPKKVPPMPSGTPIQNVAPHRPAQQQQHKPSPVVPVVYYQQQQEQYHPVQPQSFPSPSYQPHCHPTMAQQNQKLGLGGLGQSGLEIDVLAIFILFGLLSTKRVQGQIGKVISLDGNTGMLVNGFLVAVGFYAFKKFST